MGWCLACDDAVKSVMVPGGWQGGWAIDAVAAELHRDGHQVEAVTLAGLEPDGPVDVNRPPNLDTHIDQVSRTGSSTASISSSSSTPTSRGTVIRAGL